MKRSFFIIVYLLLASLLLKGQETDITLPGGVFGGLNASDDGVVGAIGGTVDVSALGGATYCIPVMVPEGINGIQPNLSIVFNSQSGNGLMGWGWNLGGLSAITRSGQTRFYDDTITSVDFHNDRFLLDGQRLMLVNEGPYGGDGAEYKTENDGMSKIISYVCDTTNGPAMFTVWLANGNIAYYGSRYDSRIGLKKNKDVCFWLLDSIVDRNGNYMSYHYYRGNIMYYLDYIVYTGNNTVSPQYKVKLLYEQGERLDKEQSFVENNSLWQTKLLKSIKVYHLPSGFLQHQYDFGYDELGLYPNQYSYEHNVSPPELAYYYNRLKTVSFSKGDYHYNPTNIEWGENDYDESNNRYVTVVTQEGGQDLSAYYYFNDRVKFTGDFNGDGLTDIVVYENSSPSDYARIYINKGNNRIPDGNSYITKLRFHRLSNSLLLRDNTDWIYVADFNGDGLDDLLCLCRERNNKAKDRIYINGYIARLDNGELLFDSIPTQEPYYKIKNTYSEAILVGDFLGEGKSQFYMQYYDPSKNEEDTEQASLFTLQNGVFHKEFHSLDFVLDAEKFTAADFDGDGEAEIIYSSRDHEDCKMVKIVKDNLWGLWDYFRFQEISGFTGGLTYWHNIFLGDFNGDGHTDVLTYVPGPNGSAGTWQINLFKGDRLEYPCYAIDSDEIGIGDPGNHGFSLQDRYGSVAYAFVEVADMNGDGKSDIVLKRSVGTSSVFRVLYAPLRRVNGITRFADIQEFSSNMYGVVTNQTICLGNFYGTESACLIASTSAWSRMPISNRYGVASIIDGMGNRTSFSFDYLTHNPLKNDNIYSLTDSGTNFGNDIYHIALPMKAVKEIKVDNASNNSIPVGRTIFSYENIFAHRKGRGFLGFERTTSERAIGWVAKNKTVCENEIQSMGDCCVAMPSTIIVYDGHDNLLSETEFSYRKYKCLRDPKRKVYIAKPIKQITDNYEILGDRSFLRRRITEQTYSYDLGIGNVSFYYNDAVLPRTTSIGTHDDVVVLADECKYLTFTETIYLPNDVVNWVFGRPRSIRMTKSKLNDNNVIKEKKTYEFLSSNPFLPYKISTYPNELSTLGSFTTYDYNDFGLVVGDTTRSFTGNLCSIKRYQYSSDGRFLEAESTISDDCGTYTNGFVYNPYYGNLRIAKDCNGYGKYTSNSDRMGITVYSSNLDPQGNAIGGSGSYHAVRWLEGSGYEKFGQWLMNPVYFTWEWKQGNAESLVIYDAAGRELRKVSFGLTLNDTIYVDTRYDGQGRVCEITEPYYSFEGTISVGKTTYEYDDYERPIKTTIYNNNGGVLFCTEYNYDGLETVTTTYRNINNKETCFDRLNIMGWKDCHIDYLDPYATNNPANQVVVRYDYYADGKLAWTKTTSNGNNNNEDTKVSMEYDALGNRVRLIDPDYGTVNSNYNAFGQLRWTISPKGDMTEFEYDGLGRNVLRTETNTNDNTQVITRWIYRDDEGVKGLIDSINYNNGEQIIHYKYDTLNRIDTVIETRYNNSYITSYEFDDFSRVKKTNYPSQYVTKNVYSDETGLLVAIKNNNWQTLWELDELNAMGQVVGFRTGDGTVSKRDYDNMHRLHTQSSLNGENVIQNFIYEYDDFGNLAARTENKYTIPVTERFTYDRLNRLDSIKLNNVTSIMAYDPHGRILSKQADGHTVFNDARYETYDQNNMLKPHAISSASVISGSLLGSRLEVDYTMFDKVKCLTQYYNNNDIERSLTYTYGYDHQRIGMEEYVKSSLYRTKKYVGNCEFNYGPDRMSTLTYLSSPTGVFAVYLSEGPNFLDEEDQGSSRLLYLHKDHLGSITTITSANGAIAQELSYDAWGNLRNPTTWSGSFSGTPLIDRGFTGHEHLYNFGLINMNGRMYDPVMSSFLSVDTYVQDPENSQSFNRYAYCLNNPLRYTDPSGELFVADDIVAAIIVGAIINGAVQTASGHVSSFGDWCLATVIGGAAGAAGAWAGGAAAGGLAGFYGGVVCGAVCGAAGGFISGTGNTWMNGGDLGDVMLDGLSKAGTGALSGGVFGGVFCGIYSYSHGGSFWNGYGATFDQISAVTIDGVPVQYNQSTAEQFSKEYFGEDIIGLNKLHADGSVPPQTNRFKWEIKTDGSVYKYKKIKGEWVCLGRTNGSTRFLDNKYFRSSDVYLYKTAFCSKEQLYLTMGHEYIHCGFNIDRNLGNPTLEHTQKIQEASCYQWEIQQARAWGYENYAKHMEGIYDGIYKWYIDENYKPSISVLPIRPW